MPEPRKDWVILRLHFAGSDLLIDYRDSRRASSRYVLPPSFEAAIRDVLAGSSPVEVLPPLFPEPEFKAEFQTLIEDDRFRMTRFGIATAPVPVFVQPPLRLEQVDWEGLVRTLLLLMFPPDKYEVVRMCRPPWKRRSPARFPIRILASEGPWQVPLERLREELSFDPNIAVHGLQVGYVRFKDLSREIGRRRCDIVFADEAGAILRRAPAMPEDRQPRLVVTGAGPRAAVSGVAVLWADWEEPFTTDFIFEFLMAIIHDMPLHEALNTARMAVGRVGGFRLDADPQTVESLRLQGAALRLRHEALRMQATVVNTAMTELGGSAMMQSLEGAAAKVMNTALDFTRESRGLGPLSEGISTLLAVRQHRRQIDAMLRTIYANPMLIESIRATQRRALDVAVERLDTDPLLETVDITGRLAAGKRYRLRAHIGNPLPGSVVVDSSPIDPLLPDPEGKTGHTLEIAVQGKDFIVIQAGVQSVYLPYVGGSDFVYFTIRAPEKRGMASLRIGIYHNNHLLQSYLLKAEVGENEYGPGETGVKVELEYSKSTNFTNLDNGTHRLLSISANHNSSGTHQIAIKGDERARGEIQLFAGTYGKSMDAFRATLEQATRDPNRPGRGRIYRELKDGEPPGEEVAEIFRTLAYQGSELYDAVLRKLDLSGSTAMQKALVKVRETSGKTIEIVRHDDNFVFPWTVLYDRDLAPPSLGVKPPVCLGVKTDSSACSHAPGENVICVNGFWGVRHYIEERIGKGVRPDYDDIVRPQGYPLVRLIGPSDIDDTGTLASGLTKNLGSNGIACGPIDIPELIRMMWADPPERPAVLIVLGHLETKPPKIPGEPDRPRIVLVTDKQWLTRDDVIRAWKANIVRWEQPRTLVLLMACDSAATTVDTINNFVTALDSAGAGAVIGTECTVFSGLAARFARELTTTLAGTPGAKLGESITNFRRSLVRSGNPLAFVFHCIGSADVKVRP
jgi:hypothetical protein